MESNTKESAKSMLTNTEGAKANLTALTWAHAVNSQKLLTNALNSK